MSRAPRWYAPRETGASVRCRLGICLNVGPTLTTNPPEECWTLADILIRRDGAIGTVIMSNPDKFNAMTTGMWRDLPLRIAELDADPSVHAIVLTGDGRQGVRLRRRHFAIRNRAHRSRRRSSATTRSWMPPTRRRCRASKPVIAKIRGICMGGGLGLAAACDIRLCALDSRFRMPAGRLGLGYKQAGVQRFVSLIGVQNTYDIFFSARVFGADGGAANGLRQPNGRGEPSSMRRCMSLASGHRGERAADGARREADRERRARQSDWSRLRNGAGRDRRLQCQRGLPRGRAGLRCEAQAGLRRSLGRSALSTPQRRTTFGFLPYGGNCLFALPPI